MTKFAVLLGVAVFLVSGFGRWRYRSAKAEAAKQPMRSGLTAAEAVEKLLDGSGGTRGRVKVVEHDAYLTDFYEPSKHRLYLSRETFRGKDAAAWGIALHEAGHAIQQAKGDPNLKVRRGMAKLSQFGGGLALLLGLFLAVLPMCPPVIGLLVGLTLWFLILVGNLVTIRTEYTANRWVLEWLDKARLLKGVDEEDEIEQVMAAACWREVGDVGRSPLLFVHHLVPLLGRKPKD